MTRILYISAGLLFLLNTSSLRAEGSVDFINYPGYRLMLRADVDQQIKTFVRAGEFINFGASHVGFMGGYIDVYRPDGTLYATYDGTNGAESIIYNDVEELHGPTGGGSLNGTGYQPSVIEVSAADEGIWSLVMTYPTTTGAAFTNLLNNAPWTRDTDHPTNRRVILAWDVTVSQNAAANDGGDMLKGRVFSNEYISMISQNGTVTSPTFYILTRDGFQYKVDFMDTDPFGFPLSAASYGLVINDFQPSYQSAHQQDLIRDADPTTWVDGQIYHYEPQAEDYESLINNKVFFNIPNADLPETALTTDVFRNNTHETWLYLVPEGISIIFNGFQLTSNSSSSIPCVGTTLEFGSGGFLFYEATKGGSAQLRLDLNNDGDFLDSIDRTIYKYIAAGGDSLFWDGRDGLGEALPQQPTFEFGYQLRVRGGECHIMMADIENNPGGVVFEMISDVGAVDTESFYYDHTPVGGPISGGAILGEAEPTTEPYTYTDNFGNKKMLDYWAFVEYQGSSAGTIQVSITDDCTTYVLPDNDGDGLTDDVDLDDDNDGIPDYLEYCNAVGHFDCLPGGFDPSGDEDGDNLINVLDADDPAFTNDCLPLAGDAGYCAIIAEVFDTDLDGVPNHLDLDSDNDGILDLYEAGHGELDANGDGVIDGNSTAFGANGFFNTLETTDDETAEATYMPVEKDNDGIPDFLDLDSDNDGINDVREAQHNYEDENNDGYIGSFPATVSARGIFQSLDPIISGMPILHPSDKDGDGVPNFHDLDSDNDLITDAIEGGGTDSDGDALLGVSPVTVDALGRPSVDINGSLTSTSTPTDKDADGIPDYLDLDSDNDMLYDATESMAMGYETDPDGDGIGGYGLVTVDEDGLIFVDEMGNMVTYTSMPDDKDGDGIPNYQDLDSDNDGINDAAEGYVYNTDPDGDGIGGYGLATFNEDGIHTVDVMGNPVPFPSLPYDTDNDGVWDFLDLDSDNDTVTDCAENGNNDPDNDGTIGLGIPAVNTDGQVIDDMDMPLSASILLDNDNDNYPNFRDLDSDNDAVQDVAEVNNSDADDDGIGGTGTPTVNTNGLLVADANNETIPTTSNLINTDEDNYPNLWDLDSDNDGINDVVEANFSDPDNDGFVGEGMPVVNGQGQVLDAMVMPYATSNPVDTDGDSHPDFRDLDSDNDGINDVEEAGLNDPDNDGYTGVGIVMTNEFGQATSDELGELLASISNPMDTDGDGNPDYQDLDSDNDGINDVEEAGFDDPDNDGIAGTGVPTVNINGQPDTTQGGVPTDNTSNPLDTDGDGNPDYQDLDSDNDGINDVEEAGFDDPDNDGIAGTGVPTVNINGQPDTTQGGVPTDNTSNPLDTDGDGNPDYQDLDSDNDGINDVEEAGFDDPDNDGIAGTGVPTVNINGQPDTTQGGVPTDNTSNPLDTDGDGNPDYQDLDSDNDGINDVEEAGFDDPDNDGIAGTGVPMVNINGQPDTTQGGVPTDNTSNPLDTDGDGNPDYQDLDSDNDGINDVEEAGFDDPDNDGIAGTGVPTVNINGQPDTTQGGVPTDNTSNPLDTDGDGNPDYQDLDSDNDGINDVEEAGFDDPDNDGIAGTGVPTVNINGQPDTTQGGVPTDNTSNPLDTDGDGNPDYQDLDSDNDGINDVEEAGFDDPDNDGIAGTGVPMVNINGQPDTTQGGVPTDNTSNPLDTDGDGNPDYQDLDSDNDGINDVEEAGFDDPDNDGIAGTGVPTVNINGQPDTTQGGVPTDNTSNPLDTDGDGNPDYQDLDSDNDGINDVEEAGFDDPDNDGIAGTGVPTVNINGQPDTTQGGVPTDNTSNPLDTDGDGNPDYQDLDSDNDGILDEDECPTGTMCVDTDMDSMPDYQDIDSDGDTLPDDEECPTGVPCVDTDGDGIPDVLEPDSDNDGIEDEDECPSDTMCVDTDGDGLPDYQDPDSDDDGILDEDECPTGAPCVDTDGDGLPDYQDPDSDDDGISDNEECPNGNPCPDSDGNGIPDVLEPSCESPLNQVTVTEVSGEGTYCEGENIVLWALIDAEEGPITYTWTGPDYSYTNTAEVGDTLFAVLETVYPVYEGAYTLQALVDDCPVLSNSIYVNIIAQPATPQLSVNSNALCAGNTLQLNSSPITGENIVYHWLLDGLIIAETTGPTYFINNVNNAETGIYAVQVSDDICISENSNSENIEIITVDGNINATNSTSLDAPSCEGTDVILSTTSYDNATYEWFGPNGYVGNSPNLLIENATVSDQGNYYAIITFADCGTQVTTNFTTIYVNPTPFEPIISANQTTTCAGENIQLSISNDLNIQATDIVNFTWMNQSTNEEVGVSMSPDWTLTNLSAANSGNYLVQVTINGCTAISENIALVINDLPDEIAMATENEIFLCSEETVILRAENPNESEGYWTALSGSIILNPTSPVTAATNLQSGTNIFVWSLSYETCENFSSDTIYVYQEAAIIAEADVFEIDFNERLTNIDLTANDGIPNLNAWTLNIVAEPVSGNVEINADGTINYTPDTNAYGEDHFIYELCNNNCANICDTALVRILIGTMDTEGACFVPNTLTPNDDGMNDAFTVPCLEDIYTSNHIIIFNRWGDKVHEAAPYRNDWRGTYKGKKLPAGTYFYILELQAGMTPIQGYFSIVQ